MNKYVSWISVQTKYSANTTYQKPSRQPHTGQCSQTWHMLHCSHGSQSVETGRLLPETCRKVPMLSHCIVRQLIVRGTSVPQWWGWSGCQTPMSRKILETFLCAKVFASVLEADLTHSKLWLLDLQTETQKQSENTPKCVCKANAKSLVEWRTNEVPGKFLYRKISWQEETPFLGFFFLFFQQIVTLRSKLNRKGVPQTVLDRAIFHHHVWWNFTFLDSFQSLTPLKQLFVNN